ncbi:precorrin-6A synthase (deacetylating) [Gordonia amarae]|uniref:Precorrin-6A synthase n=2 Tax=Gordonia amarae TaxID=36821 RepID=G7GS30_9ACTN|nr:precorrin-6A synthase (deacetylating) [Gordonia amarae]MCS3877941.1 precorrin-6A synthase [Gordonia amarae]QHN16651.1 precorrin-6A synthase (deacetylating) [Gordonia amarae]QHN21176.1 precorrin-6A synthase (deacetylating) [Gordonia amarae]QHN30030.1 precorrin-6A synthase (deacetylating) [Gordonia amarae]QHN38803.1 precorrin-6A synthase (deacetylating) [Gordonia amarae]
MSVPVTLRVIGIGPGGPEHVTFAAADAMVGVDAFLFLDKGSAKQSLLDARREILDRYAPQGYRMIEIADPPRDRNPADYAAEVRRWHSARASAIEQVLLEDVGEGGVAAFLVWGDPALYDSTLRIVDDLTARGVLAPEVTVIPGVTSISALTAAHRIPLNRIGEPIHITTGRLLASTPDGASGNQVVMLDSYLTFTETADPDDEIWWGAYVGTADEILISGRVADVAEEIAETRSRARESIGWLMDVYLLRKNTRSPDLGE